MIYKDRPETRHLSSPPVLSPSNTGNLICTVNTVPTAQITPFLETSNTALTVSSFTGQLNFYNVNTVVYFSGVSKNEV